MLIENEHQVKKWLSEHKAVTWLQHKLETLNTNMPKVEWDKVRERLKSIPPGIVSLDYVRLIQKSKTMEGVNPQLQKNLDWVAKVASKLAKQTKDKQVHALVCSFASKIVGSHH